MIDYKKGLPEAQFNVVSGFVDSTRSQTLFSNPFEILPGITQSNYNSIIPIGIILRINCNAFTVGLIQNFYIGFQIPIIAQLPGSTGAFFSLNNPLPDISPGTGWFTLGTRQQTQHTNYTSGSVPVVLMTDADDPNFFTNGISYSFMYCKIII